MNHGDSFEGKANYRVSQHSYSTVIFNFMLAQKNVSQHLKIIKYDCLKTQIRSVGF